MWKVSYYRIGRYRAWHWEISDGMLGSSGRTPIGAFLNYLRWKREYRRNPRKYVQPDQVGESE